MLTLSVLPGLFAVCRLEAGSVVPGWAMAGDFFSITRTSEEVSVVCPAAVVPPGIRHEPDWRALKVHGPLDFALTGILANLAGALDAASISLFALSTYDTDYLLVREHTLAAAVHALTNAGHVFVDESTGHETI